MLAAENCRRPRAACRRKLPQVLPRAACNRKWTIETAKDRDRQKWAETGRNGQKHAEMCRCTWVEAGYSDKRRTGPAVFLSFLVRKEKHARKQAQSLPLRKKAFAKGACPETQAF